jgi:hypothetical protein
MDKQTSEFKITKRQLPIAKNEDVEFSKEQADQKDMEAARRSDHADWRQK